MKIHLYTKDLYLNKSPKYSYKTKYQSGTERNELLIQVTTGVRNAAQAGAHPVWAHSREALSFNPWKRKRSDGPQWGVEVGVWLGEGKGSCLGWWTFSTPGCGGGYRYKPLSDSLYHTLRMGAKSQTRGSDWTELNEWKSYLYKADEKKKAEILSFITFQISRIWKHQNTPSYLLGNSTYNVLGTFSVLNVELPLAICITTIFTIFVKAESKLSNLPKATEHGK